MKNTFIKILGTIFLIMVICQQVGYAYSVHIDGSPYTDPVGDICRLIIIIAVSIYILLIFILLILKFIESIKGVKKDHKIIGFLQFLCGMLCFLPFVVVFVAKGYYLMAVLMAATIILSIISMATKNKTLAIIACLCFLLQLTTVILY